MPTFHEALAVLATVSVVVWTAALVIRTLGHQVKLALIEAMNYTQVVFMGSIVPLFASPQVIRILAITFAGLAILVNAQIFMAYKIYKTTGVTHSPIIQWYGLEDRYGIARWLAFEAVYLLALAIVAVFPVNLVIVWALWILLYLALQLFVIFILMPPNLTEYGSKG